MCNPPTPEPLGPPAEDAPLPHVAPVDAYAPGGQPSSGVPSDAPNTGVQSEAPLATDIAGPSHQRGYPRALLRRVVEVTPRRPGPGLSHRFFSSSSFHAPRSYRPLRTPCRWLSWPLCSVPGRLSLWRLWSSNSTTTTASRRTRSQYGAPGLTISWFTRQDDLHRVLDNQRPDGALFFLRWRG